MILPTMVAVRRSLRKHQGLPAESASRLPLWRLLLGEVWWAVRSLFASPGTLAGMVIGFVGTLAVLGARAPGPFVQLSVRVLVATAVGLLFAVGVRAGRSVATPSADTEPAGPLTAATVVASVVAAGTLVVWLVVWVIAAMT